VGSEHRHPCAGELIVLANELKRASKQVKF
jgi:hypothetical protein